MPPELAVPLFAINAEQGTVTDSCPGSCPGAVATAGGQQAELRIHRQTLGYRIRKIEQITGRGVTRTDHIAQWLRARDLLSGRPVDVSR